MEDVGDGEIYMPINCIAFTSGQYTQQMSATTNMQQPTYDMISFVVVVTLFFHWSKSRFVWL